MDTQRRERGSGGRNGSGLRPSLLRGASGSAPRVMGEGGNRPGARLSEPSSVFFPQGSTLRKRRVYQEFLSKVSILGACSAAGGRGCGARVPCTRTHAYTCAVRPPPPTKPRARTSLRTRARDTAGCPPSIRGAARLCRRRRARVHRVRVALAEAHLCRVSFLTSWLSSLHVGFWPGGLSDSATFPGLPRGSAWLSDTPFRVLNLL